MHAIYGAFFGAPALLAGSLMGVPVFVRTHGRDLMLGMSTDDR